MDNDSKNVLMQYLYRFAEHEGIPDATQVSFKKREGLMESLKDKNYEAWLVMSNLIEAFIREDRLVNDREKKEKAYPLWESEHATAEKEKVKAEQFLIQYCKDKHITVGAIDVAQTR
jgi:hypothetical protein